jgi:dimethylhistidine N-methyltransferase
MVQLPTDGQHNEGATIVELGSGSAIKTQRLIEAGLTRYGKLHYIPIDVSPSALDESARRLVRQFPSLRITGYVADYRRGLERLTRTANGPRLIVFLGSSLGNYEMDEAAELLTMISSTMRPTDRFLLGTDLAKNRVVLESAYDDAQGVTAAFNLNLLHRINRELEADFQVDGFAHRAVYRPDRGRVEMHLVCTRPHTVHIPAAGLSVEIRQDESIHTESSHKYTDEMLAHLARVAGFEEEASWADRQGWFRLGRWCLSDGGSNWSGG